MLSNTDTDLEPGSPVTRPDARAPVLTIRIEENRPLHERVPVRDEEGLPLGDFMVLIPGLRDLSPQQLGERLQRLQTVLHGFTEVVFADLNLPLNLLWVSVRPRPGVILELFGAMQWQLPEARLVGHRQE